MNSSQDDRKINRNTDQMVRAPDTTKSEAKIKPRFVDFLYSVCHLSARIPVRPRKPGMPLQGSGLERHLDRSDCGAKDGTLSCRGWTRVHARGVACPVRWACDRYTAERPGVSPIEPSR